MSDESQGFQGSYVLILQPCNPKARAERQKERIRLAEERMGKQSVGSGVGDGRGDAAKGVRAQFADVGEGRRNGGGGDDVDDEVDRGHRRGLRSERGGRRRGWGLGAGRVSGDGVAGVSITQDDAEVKESRRQGRRHLHQAEAYDGGSAVVVEGGYGGMGGAGTAAVGRRRRRRRPALDPLGEGHAADGRADSGAIDTAGLEDAYGSGGEGRVRRRRRRHASLSQGPGGQGGDMEEGREGKMLGAFLRRRQGGDEGEGGGEAGGVGGAGSPIHRRRRRRRLSPHEGVEADGGDAEMVSSMDGSGVVSSDSFKYRHLSQGGGRGRRSLSDGYPHEDDAFHTIMQWLYSKMDGISAPRHLEK